MLFGLESNRAIVLTDQMLSKQTKHSTYRYSRWKSPAKASSRMTVNELEFSNLKRKDRFQCGDVNLESHGEAFVSFPMSWATSKYGFFSTSAWPIRCTTQLADADRKQQVDSLWLDFLVTPITLPFLPCGSQGRPWELLFQSILKPAQLNSQRMLNDTLAIMEVEI